MTDAPNEPIDEPRETLEGDAAESPPEEAAAASPDEAVDDVQAPDELLPPDASEGAPAVSEDEGPEASFR